jgi:hypothetical protein
VHEHSDAFLQMDVNLELCVYISELDNEHIA